MEEVVNRPADSVAQILPLSEEQKGLWYIHQLAPDTAAYNVVLPARLFERLDEPAWRQALDALAQRHPMLRATFHVGDDGTAEQRIEPTWPIPLTCVDARALTGEALLEALREESTRPFSLARGAVRMALFHVAEKEHVMVLTAHHLVADGWSLVVIFGELAQLYRAQLHGGSATLPQVGSTYANHVVRQADMLVGDRGERQWRFWQEQLKGELPVLALPTDHKRPAVQGFKGALAAMALPDDLMRAMRRFARDHGVTLNSAFLSAYIALLHRYSGQDELVVGIPTAGRDDESTAYVVGDYVNTVPIRCDVADDPRFLQLMMSVHEQVLTALDYRDFPFTHLVNRLQPSRDPSRSPIFQTIFTWERAHGDNVDVYTLALGEAGIDVSMEGMRFQSVGLEQQLGQFDLEIMMVEGRDAVAAFFKYNIDLFTEATIGRMGRHFATLLQGIVANPQARISALPLSDKAEQTKLLESFCGGSANFGKEGTVHELFASQAAAAPDAPALTFVGTTMTYGVLNQRANQLANYLLSQYPLGPGVLVGLACERSLELVIAIVGILKTGAAYVPIDVEYPPERQALILEDTGAPVLLTQRSVASNLPQHHAAVVLLDDDWPAIAACPAHDPPSLAGPDDGAYVIYTSGSTGKPKGVYIPHHNVVRLFRATDSWFHFGRDDVWTLFHSHAFDFSVWEIWGPLLYGGRLVVVPQSVSRNPQLFYQLVVDERVTVLNQTPSAFKMFSDFEHNEMKQDGDLCLRYVIFGGEALDFACLTPWFERHGYEKPLLVNMYGITETTVHVSYYPLTRDAVVGESASIIGRPIPDLEVYVLDKYMRVLPVGLTGELYVGGPGCARGYLNRPALTNERFIPSPYGKRLGARLYRTGDLARFHEDGNLEYLGRCDHQVKIRGFRIELGEVDARLREHPHVRDVLVLALADRVGDKHLVAYVVSTSGAHLDVGALRAFVGQTLPAYMIPASFVFVDAFPLTAHGKIDRRALPPPGQAQREGTSAAPSSAPRSVLERQLAAIWAEVLEVEHVGVHDNYFALGGDSIRSIHVLSLARQQGLALSLRELLQFQTVAKLAEHLTGERHEDRETVASVAFSLVSRADREKLPESAVDAYPVSCLQRGMLYHGAQFPSGGVYHDIFSYRFAGKVDVAALQRAVDAVVAAHPALRTSFALGAYSEPLQIVHKEALLKVVVHEQNHDTEDERRRSLDAWMEHERENDFDWSVAPLMRMRLDVVADAVFWLTMSFHHAILDGWSLATAITQIFAVHQMISRGAQVVCRSPKSAFRDYIAREREEIGAAENAAFWQEHLAEAPSGAITPWYAPAVHGPPKIENLAVDVDEWTSDGVKEAAKALGVPLKCVLLAAHMRTMAELVGSFDVLTGVLAQGRLESEEGDQVLGLFLNTLPWRQRIPDTSWRGLIRMCFEHEQMLAGYSRYPLREMQKSLGVERLFDCVFYYTHFHVYAELQNVGVRLTDQRLIQVTNFPLLAAFVQDVGSERVSLLLEYDSNMYGNEQMTHIADVFARVLRNLAKNLDGRVRDLPTPDAQNEAQRAFATFAGHYPPATQIADLIAAHVAGHPDDVAVASKQGDITYGALDAQANRFSTYLRGLGIGAEDVVALCLERSPALVWSMLGVLRAGAAMMPLDPTHPPLRLRRMLQAAESAFLVSTPSLVSQLGDVVARASTMEEVAAALEGLAVHDTPVSVRGDELAYVMFTSGSTGSPRGVCVTHDNVASFFRWVRGAYTPAELKGVFSATSPGFDLFVFEVFAPLCSGGAVIFGDDLAALVDAALGPRTTLVNTVPSLLSAFLTQHGLPPSVSVVNLAGEPLGQDLVDRVAEAGQVRRIVNAYGPTETTVYATWCEVEPGGVGAPAIGRPVADAEVRVVDADMRPCDIGVAGELLVGGKGVAKGYLNDDAESKRRFVELPTERLGMQRFYRTGDRVRFLPDGRLAYMGRLDAQIKVRGVRIEPGEVEAVLSQHSEVRECVVAAATASGDATRAAGAGRRSALLAAYVVCAGERAPRPAALREFVAEQLPGPMVPEVFVFLAALPRTPRGKLDRAALPPVDREILRRAGGHRVARDRFERLVAGVFAQVLGQEDVGLHEHFADLGGDSLTCMEVSVRLAVLGTAVSTREVFTHPTVAQLAQLLRARGGVPQTAAEDGPGLLPLAPGLLAQMEPHLPQDCWVLGFVSEDGAFATTAPQALAHLWREHDGLRVRYVAQGGDLAQEIIAADLPLPLTTRPLGAGIAGRLAFAQEMMGLQRGILSGELTPVQFVLRTGQDGTAELCTAELFLVAHCGALDGTSLRIFAEDFLEQVAVLGRGLMPAPVVKTASPRRWVSQLCGDGIGQDGQHQARWREILAEEGLVTAKQLLGFGDGHAAEASGALTATFAGDQERLAVQIVSAAAALGRWLGCRTLVVEVQHRPSAEAAAGHEGGVDVSRTVGWCGAVYPLRVVVDGDLGALVQQTRRDLQDLAIPGLKFGRAPGYAEARRPLLRVLDIGSFGDLQGDLARVVAGPAFQGGGSGSIDVFVYEMAGQQVMTWRAPVGWPAVPLALLLRWQREHVESIVAVSAVRTPKPPRKRRPGAFQIGEDVLVPIQPRGSRRPFFCLPPARGDVLSYFALANLLGDEQPFYGLQARGLDGLEEPFASVEEAAAVYRDAILRVQPHGPYALGGWSGGGVVVVELAQQLQNAGEPIAMVLVLDIMPPRYFPQHTPQALVQNFMETLVNRSLADLMGAERVETFLSLPVGEQLERFLEIAQGQHLVPDSTRLAELRGLCDVWRGAFMAIWAHTPSPYHGDIQLILADKGITKASRVPAEDTTVGWGEVVAGEVAVHRLGGDHYTMMNRPHVEDLARIVGGCLRDL